MHGYNEVTAELLVNNVEVAIKSFQFNVPTGRLGSILNVRLATPDVSQVPNGASIKFSLKIRTNGVQSSYVLLDDGKLQERNYTMTYRGGENAGPQDEVSFGALDVLSDKFGLGPRRPVVMFDPSRTRYDNVQTRSDQLLRTETQGLILPVIEPVYGLTMKQVLDRAYTGRGGFLWIMPIGSGYTNFTWPSLIGTSSTDQTGCGFEKVVTNIPDYPVRRADFTIEGGWHDGAQSVVAMYSPIYFVEGTTLFILDVERPLPAGMNAHYVPISSHKSLSERLEFKPEANAILLTYQYNANDPGEDPGRVSRDVFHDEVVDETGGYGAVGYSKVTTRRWDREFYMADNPTQVLDTLPLHVEVETQQSIIWYNGDGDEVVVGVRVTHQETTEYLYEGDLKIRHIKETKADIVGTLFPIERETCEISWEEDSNNPGVKLQSRVRTDIQGVCAYDTANTEEIDGETVVRMIPILLAHSGGLVQDTWALTPLIPVKSIRETLQNMKGNQYDVEVVETDYINNTLKRSFTQPVTGTIHNDPYEAKSRTVLLRDTVSEALIGTRVPVSVNAYELPRLRALELGHRALRRLKNPLHTLPIALPGVDFVIARGSVIQGQKRSSNTTKYFVTGYTITGDNLGKEGHRIQQTLDAVEIGETA